MWDSENQVPPVCLALGRDLMRGGAVGDSFSTGAAEPGSY